MAKPKGPSNTASPASEDTQEQDAEVSGHGSPKTARKTQSKASKPRLTAHQKNTNHKDAENKRRNAIREQFTELSNLVPGAEGLERSEFVMLQKTIIHFREQIDERRRITAEIEAKGRAVPEHLKLGPDQWGGPKWHAKNTEDFDRAKARRPGNSNETQTGDSEEEED